MTSHVDLDALALTAGAHEHREQGVCLLEAVGLGWLLWKGMR